MIPTRLRHRPPKRTQTKLATLAAVLLSTLMLGACTSAVGQQISPSDGEPVEGGVIRIGSAFDLNPSAFLSGLPDHGRAAFDTLTEYGSDGLEPKPLLAESWEVSADGLSVTLNLRDDVTFHDGRPFTSEDVKFSLSTYSDPKNAGQLARTAQRIRDYDTTDPHRVVLHLSQPTNNIFDLFENAPILHEESFAQFKTGEAYIGTGPFRFVNWTPGNSVVYEANPDYWGGKPHVDGIEVIIVPDQKTKFSQLRSGQVDIIQGGSRDAQALADNAAFNVLNLAGTSNITYLGTNVTAPSLSDPRVRRAFFLAVDRQRILDEVYQGRGRASTLPWPEYSPAYDASADQVARDVEQARELIAEVESEQGELPTFPLVVLATSLEMQTAAQIVADNLAEIGVEVNIEPTEQTSVISQLINGEFEALWLYGHTFSQFNPSTQVSAAFPFNSAKNASNFQNDEYSAAVDRSWNTPDPNGPQALEAYEDLNEQLLKHNFLIELSLPDTELITAGNLHDVKWNKRGIYNLSDAYFTR